MLAETCPIVSWTLLSPEGGKVSSQTPFTVRNGCPESRAFPGSHVTVPVSLLHSCFPRVWGTFQEGSLAAPHMTGQVLGRGAGGEPEIQWRQDSAFKLPMWPGPAQGLEGPGLSAPRPKPPSCPARPSSCPSTPHVRTAVPIIPLTQRMRCCGPPHLCPGRQPSRLRTTQIHHDGPS